MTFHLHGTIAIAIVLALVATSSTALAGRNVLGWSYGTDVLPERGVELQSWTYEQNGKPPDQSHETDLWWALVVGVTDHLELALPVETAWQADAANPPSFTLQRYGIEARYRFVTQDPVDAPDVVPLARVAVKRDVESRDRVQLEADLVGSYQHGRVFALVDAGVVGARGPGFHHVELRPSGGISVRVAGDLRLGVEAHAELVLDVHDGESWAVVGPDLAWAHGRFWVAATYGLGVYKIDTAPRVQWGVWF